MSIRPVDLESKEGLARLALHCGDCLAAYPAEPAAYEWMFPHDTIVCEGCGSELVLTELAALD